MMAAFHPGRVTTKTTSAPTRSNVTKHILCDMLMLQAGAHHAHSPAVMF